MVAFVFILLPFDPILSGCQYSDEAGSLSSSKVSRRCDPKTLPKDGLYLIVKIVCLENYTDVYLFISFSEIYLEIGIELHFHCLIAFRH